MSTECTKTARGNRLLEWLFQAARRRVPSLSEKFHPCVQKRPTLHPIYQLGHIYAVNVVRLALDTKYGWKSERRYKAEELDKKAKRGDSLGPIPDGLLITKDGVIALEIEISPKKPAEVEQKLIRLVRYSVSDGLYGYRSGFPVIWFYVPSESIKTLIESCCDVLTDDERRRVSIGIEPKLLYQLAFRLTIWFWLPKPSAAC